MSQTNGLGHCQTMNTSCAISICNNLMRNYWTNHWTDEYILYDLNLQKNPRRRVGQVLEYWTNLIHKLSQTHNLLMIQSSDLIWTHFNELRVPVISGLGLLAKWLLRWLKLVMTLVRPTISDMQSSDLNGKKWLNKDTVWECWRLLTKILLQWLQWFINKSDPQYLTCSEKKDIIWKPWSVLEVQDFWQSDFLDDRCRDNVVSLSPGV